MKNIIKNTFAAAAAALAIYYSLKYPYEMGNSIKDSIERCFDVIIPSMFIFLCLTSYISISGLHSIIGAPLAKITGRLFRLPEEGIVIFILSLISGYPAGIKLVGEGVQSGKLTLHQAKIMSCFCCCGGPAFISGTAAACLYPGSNAALLIFISVISANVVTALILTRKLERVSYKADEKRILNAGAVIPAVRSASSAMLGMCTMIAAFGGVICILYLSGAIGWLSDIAELIGISNRSTAERIIMSFLEISNIANLPAMQPSLFPVVSFLLSFGGVCVAMQIAAIGRNCIDIKLFIVSRLFTAFCSAFISRFLIRFLDIEISCLKPCVSLYHKGSSPVSSVLLFIMMFMTLILIEKQRPELKKC